jgi:hypothetical protein
MVVIIAGTAYVAQRAWQRERLEKAANPSPSPDPVLVD